MKILFTGISSFTGFWFAKKLSEAGHQIFATLTRPVLEYDDEIRKRRLDLIKYSVVFKEKLSFGDDNFLRLISEEKFDLICLHGANVTNYKNPDFNVLNAVTDNCNNVYSFFKSCSDAGINKLVITGSVFEGGEGAGSEKLPHFSPYGLSKYLSSEIFKYYANIFKINLGKFVIPNPFGAYEEKRFLNHLIKNWLLNQVPKVNTPLYIRDNIHVELLADYYADFVAAIAVNTKHTFYKLAPIGYIESQGSFTARVANEMRIRLNKECEFELGVQEAFTEPLFRVNTDFNLKVTANFHYSEAWDNLASYYLKG